MTRGMPRGTFALLHSTGAHCIPFRAGGSWPGAHLRDDFRLV